MYVPVRRKGGSNKADSSKYDINSRTVPLSSLSNIAALEDTIPSKIKGSTFELGGTLNPMEAPKALSQSGYLIAKKGGRAAEDRMTSAAMRAERNQKRDVEEMVHYTIYHMPPRCLR